MSRTFRPSSPTIRRRSLISTVAVMLAAAAALLSITGRTGNPYPDIQRLLESNVAPAMDALSGSIAEHPAEMIPP
jgi:hypothetical protein